MPLTPESASEGARRFELGVLFVHGIGKPRQSETLIAFGDALATGLEATLPHARLASPPLRHPAHAELSMKVYGEASEPRDARWLLAEGYWADAIIAPSFGSLLRWSFGILPHTLLTHFHQAIPGAPRADGSRTRALVRALAVRVPLTVLATLAALLLAPLVVALLLVVLVIGSLPFAAAKEVAGGFQRVLARTIGDSMTLLDSPIQRAAILDRVHESYRWLAVRCERVAVVAHSQGAAIAHEMLRTHDCPRVGLLITFGSGLRKLTEIREFVEKGSGGLWLAAGCVVGAVACVYRIIGIAGLGGAVPLGAVLALMIVLVASVNPIYDGVEAIMRWYNQRFRAPQPELDLWSSIFRGVAQAIYTIYAIVGVCTIVYFTATGFIAADLLAAGKPASTWWLFGFAACLWIAVFALFDHGRESLKDEDKRREEDRRRFESVFRLPDGIRWVDLYTAADPVPNGPLVSDPSGIPGFESIAIQNRASVLLDHTAYWQNREQFVTRVADELQRLANPAAAALDYAERAALRDARIAALRRTRVVVLACAFALAWIGWDHLLAYSATTWPSFTGALDDVPVIGERLADSLPASWGASAGAVLAAVGIGAAFYTAAFFVWAMWDAALSKKTYVRPSSVRYFYVLPAAAIAGTAGLAAVRWLG